MSRLIQIIKEEIFVYCVESYILQVICAKMKMTFFCLFFVYVETSCIINLCQLWRSDFLSYINSALHSCIINGKTISGKSLT